MSDKKPDTEKKEYEKPAIKLELDLEIRAGSPGPCVPGIDDILGLSNCK